MIDLNELIGDAVSLLIFKGPLPIVKIEETECLIIKRPPYDDWKPNRFSPVTGCVEEKDVKKLKTFPPPWTAEKLYIETGKREFKEEVKIGSSVLTLRYIGKYHDSETGYDVAVLPGEIYGAGTTAEKIIIPKIKVTGEAPKIYWKNIKEIQEHIENSEFAGEKSIEMVVKNLQKFI